MVSTPPDGAEPQDDVPRGNVALTSLRIPDFSFFIVSRFCSITGETLLSAAVAWQVFELSGSAFQLGLIGLVRFLPHLAFSLVGGVVADSYDRKRVIMLARVVPFVCGAALAWTTSEEMATLPLIYGLVFATAVASAFQMPASSALLPTLVPRSVFPGAVTVSSTVISLARVTGPAFAGLVIAAQNIATAYLVQVALIATSIATLTFVRGRSATQTGRSGMSLAAVREGIAFVRRKRVVLGAMTLDMFAVIFGGATALLPIYANDILQVGPRGYGLLTSSLEIGAVLTSAVLIALPPIQRMGRALIIAVAVYGLATIAFGVSRSFPLSVLAYVVVGMADQVSVVTRQTLIQLSTPDELRGRVSSVNMVFIGASNHLGAVEAGFVAALTSATFAVVSGGIACLSVLAVVTAKIPELRRHRY